MAHQDLHRVELLKDSRISTLSSEARRRTDLMGFNSTWWIVLAWIVLIILIFLPVPGVVMEMDPAAHENRKR
jgi:hypothetical protein